MNLPLKFSSGGKQGKFKGSGNMLPLVQLSRVQGRCYTRSALSPGKKRKEYAQMPLDFDHLVLMVRDQLTEHAQQLLQDGFHLTDLEVHNLGRSEEHTSELQSLMRTSYAAFYLKKQKQ